MLKTEGVTVKIKALLCKIYILSDVSNRIPLKLGLLDSPF